MSRQRAESLYRRMYQIHSLNIDLSDNAEVAAIHAALKAERELCAQLCEKNAETPCDYEHAAALGCAKDIRAMPDD